jgi:ribosomal subunit interface protein
VLFRSQVNTGDALRTHVEDRLHAIADKYFSRSLSAHVTFGRGQHGNGFSCDIVAHVMHGVILKGSGHAMEAHPSFDQAADRVETQLRRYMNRLKSRNGANGLVPSLEAIDDNAGYTVFEAPREEEEGEACDSPVIIAETRVDVPDASVSDAVMMLDLRNTTALLFRNSGTGAFNMVYRRSDGTIGWVEPSRAAG